MSFEISNDLNIRLKRIQEVFSDYRSIHETGMMKKVTPHLIEDMFIIIQEFLYQKNKENELSQEEFETIKEIIYFEIEALKGHGDEDSEAQLEKIKKIYDKLEK